MKNTIENLLKYGTEELEKEKIEDTKLKAKLLLAFLGNVPKEYLIIHKEEILNNKIVEQYKEGIQKIKEGTPFQYVTHHQEFMGLNFYVDENVLIPRFDTEILVEEILQKAIRKGKLKILDMCTGSGAIAISLAKKITNSKVYGADINKNALKIAKKNNESNQTNVELIQSDMFSNIREKEFDIIVCNPPYIETATLNTLENQVKKEPIIALDGGQDGLKFYRILANQAYQYLKPNGILAVEIGYNQKESVIEILENTGKYNNINCKKDLCGNNRIILCNSIC